MIIGDVLIFKVNKLTTRASLVHVVLFMLLKLFVFIDRHVERQTSFAIIVEELDSMLGWQEF